MTTSSASQLAHLKVAIAVVIQSWKENAADPKMSKSRRSISQEHAEGLRLILERITVLEDNAINASIENVAYVALSDAMLAELDRQTALLKEGE